MVYSCVFLTALSHKIPFLHAMSIKLGQKNKKIPNAYNGQETKVFYYLELCLKLLIFKKNQITIANVYFFFTVVLSCKNNRALNNTGSYEKKVQYYSLT